VAGLKPRPFGVLIDVLQEVLDRVDTASLLDFCGRSPPWSAAAKLPPFAPSSDPCAKAVATLPHSKARTRGPLWTSRGQSIDSTMVVRQAARPMKPLHAEFKELTNHVSGERRSTISSFFCRWRGPSIDSAMVVGRFTEERRRGLGESKGLATGVSAEQSSDLFGLCGAMETRRGRSGDSARLNGKFTEESGRTSAQSKRLTDRLFAEPYAPI